MRLVANIRLHPKTGIYQFRKAVPEDVRDHLPEIPDLPGKPGRVEITKSLGTRIKAEANREANRLDALVEAAIEQARQQLARRASGQAVTATGNPSGPPKPIDPRTAFAALARWEATAIREAEQRLFNAPVTDRLTEEDARRGDIIVALRARPIPACASVQSSTSRPETQSSAYPKAASGKARQFSIVRPTAVISAQRRGWRQS
jgi:hypothetical protein